MANKLWTVNELRLLGKFNESGEFVLYGINDLKDFGEMHAGSKIIVEVSVLHAETSKAMIGFFHKVIVPEYIKAFKEIGDRKTNKEMVEFISNTMPTAINNGCRIEDLDRINMWHLIEECKQYAAENLSLYIADAIVITNK